MLNFIGREKFKPSALKFIFNVTTTRFYHKTVTFQSKYVQLQLKQKIIRHWHKLRVRQLSVQ